MDKEDLLREIQGLRALGRKVKELQMLLLTAFRFLDKTASSVRASPDNGRSDASYSLMVRPNVVVLASPRFFVRFPDKLSDWQTLRAFPLTGSAIQAFRRPVFSDRFIVFFPGDTQILILMKRVQTGEHIRYPDSGGTAFVHAVAATRTADRTLAFNHCRRFFQHCAFAVRQRLVPVQHDADIFFHRARLLMPERTVTTPSSEAA